MSSDSNLLIFGASTRAAAFSALRAGLRPWCADLFADADLETRCPVFRIPSDQYPQGFLKVTEQAVQGPWMFTGGLENRARLVRRIAERRLLWGIGPDELKRMRSPRIFSMAGVPCPSFWHEPRCDVPHGTWLVKPWASAGGTGIRHWSGRRPTGAVLKSHYFQEYIEGDSSAAIFLGDGQNAKLLGVTRQLVGESWLHAAPFHYCGSIGPIRLSAELSDTYERLGTALVKLCRPRGLFGVDCVLRGNVPWPVEVNPRYTASIEVLEYGAGVPAMALHRSVFDPDAPTPKANPRAAGMVGKAILFARAPLVFPSEGPWLASLRSPPALDQLPDFADIPHAGERIENGWPILTLFARAESETACARELRAISSHLDQWLFER